MTLSGIVESLSPSETNLLISSKLISKDEIPIDIADKLYKEYIKLIS